MSENVGIVIITTVGICTMSAIAYFCSKIMINTLKYSRSKK